MKVTILGDVYVTCIPAVSELCKMAGVSYMLMAPSEQRDRPTVKLIIIDRRVSDEH